MANKNLTKESIDALESVCDRIHVLQENGNALAIGVYSMDNKKMVMYNTNTWDSESLVMLSEVVTAYICNEYTWEELRTYDDSASVTKIQLANERGNIENQLRTYVKDEKGKKNRGENHELERKIDLQKELIKNDWNIDLIKGKLIDKYSDDIDFLNENLDSFDLEKCLSYQPKKYDKAVKVDASHILNGFQSKKINDYIEKLEKAKRELLGV